MTQIELHERLDDLIEGGPSKVKSEDVLALISVNNDANQYFFTKVNERWLTWLSRNGFFNVLKRKSDDPTRYSYSTPELAYLERIATKDPKAVTDIILAVPISSATYNPEVVDRFSRICSNLTADQLKRVVSKIRDERWIPLMGAFGQYGFEYERMLKTLTEAKEYDSVLILAQAVLTLRTKEEMGKDSRGYLNENPFYFSGLEYTKVFEYLVAVDEEKRGDALKLTLDTLQKIILKGKSEDEKVFAVDETFHLYHIDDFFTLSLFGRHHGSFEEDVDRLVAAAKILAEKLFTGKCEEANAVRDLYSKHFIQLPDSRSFWRLRLYVLSLCPSALKDEIKQSLFRLFGAEQYHELFTVEYQKTLQKSFAVLDESDKRSYISQVFGYFGKKVEDKDVQVWRLRDGLQILSCICSELTVTEQENCVKIFGEKCNPDYQPEVPPPTHFAGTVRARGPITFDEVSRLSIEHIIEKLKKEWTPEKLRPQNKPEDFLHPLNAEGVGSLLKEDMVKRLQEYVASAQKFFDREHLETHYTYAFFRGIEEILRENKVSTENINWTGLLNLGQAIKESGEKVPFENEGWRKRDIYGGWLANWTSVHSVMADVLIKLLTEKDGKVPLRFEENRNTLFGIVQYLLTHSDPNPEDEKIETAKHKVKSPGQDYELGDPFTAAINSVRGRAFQVLTNFVYLDGKKYSREDEIKIADDLKKVYEATLAHENTQAIMFMFGHYLPSYYYRDKVWIRGLVPQIFPLEREKLDVYLAAWEGYLSTSLYEEMFEDSAIEKLYYRAIDNDPLEYTKRRYVRELDEGLAVHLALAFMYYDFGFDNGLFKKFWGVENTDRFGGFISFIGRSFVSGDNKQSDKLLKEKPASKQKLHDFWDWALEHCKDAEALKEFGFWMNTEKGVFEISWLAEHIRRTLEKTGGIIEWDYGLMRSISTYAKNVPRETLGILRLLLLEGGVRSKRMARPFYMENESFEAFKILYQNGNSDFRKEIYKLIDDLIREGGSTFWKLKDVLENTTENSNGH